MTNLSHSVKVARSPWSAVGKCALCVALWAMLCAHSVVAQAQQAKKVPRIGYLSPFDPTRESTRAEAIQRALRERGYVEGQNITTEGFCCDEKAKQ
jgi:hypothetical protein